MNSWSPTQCPLPRLGFVGVGWIGAQRLDCIAKSGLAAIAGVADPGAENTLVIAQKHKGVFVANSLEELLSIPLDGLVIATPNFLHASQAICALERGIPVFCQKPLARNAQETRRVIEIARRNNRLISVDLSYRGLRGARQIRQLIGEQKLGRVFAAELVFHNAYGPDKPWFYDLALSGGGCLIDLGVHLVDLALWCLGNPKIVEVSSQLFSKGVPVLKPAVQLEDFAVARLRLEDGGVVQLACSWNLSAGCDAQISASFYGTNGGAELRNLNGSFTEFSAARFEKTHRERLVDALDTLGGWQALEWARQIASNPCYDPAIESLIAVASTLDQIYGR